MGFFNYLKSTLLSKVVMALTGVLLVLFILGHTLGNMQIFLGREVFNTYAHFLQSLGELLWIIRLVLFISLALHVITSIRLKARNWSANPTKYKVVRYIKAKIASRTMFWTGLMIFAFLVYHLLHFTIGSVHPEYYGKTDYAESNAVMFTEGGSGELGVPMKDGSGPHRRGDCLDAKETGCDDAGEECRKIEKDGKTFYIDKRGEILEARHDVFYMVIKGFQIPAVSIAYIIGVILLGFHLSHAIQSMFQTIGWNHPSYFGWLQGLSVTLAVLIAGGLISIPVAILLGYGGGCV